ncbi:MAG: group 1 truncated hemoglobin [Rudaea sp.]|nr:group 1 truncated hemoglobin [Rudaea sp.]
MRNLLLAFALLATLGCAGPAGKPVQTSVTGDALYRNLGGTEGITRVVDAFLPRVNGDARINGLFLKVDHDDLRHLIIEQLCTATGGPCTYTGRSMQEAHSGLNLTNADFNAFVEDLVAAMDQVKVRKTSQRELLALLAPMRMQIVGQ